MSLSLALQNALTGLEINQRALSVISHNVANANTEGYTRQQADLSSVYYDGVGAGVKVEDITRKVDIYLEQAIQKQTASVGRTTVIEDFMERIQILLGEPGQANSLDEYIENFFNGLQDLAETPDSVSFQETAVDAGIILAREISKIATDLEELRYEADRDINESVRIINEELRNIDNLNTAIARANALGNPTAGLKDEQAMALERLSEYLKVETFLQDNNTVHVHTAEGVVLLSEQLYEVDYNRADAVDTFIDGVALSAIQVYALDEDGTRTGQAFELASNDISGEIDSIIEDGRLKGLMDLRDTVIPEILDQLDEIADHLRDTFNAIHNDGSSYPGTNVLTGTREVSSVTTSEWTGNVQIAVLDEDGQPVNSAYDTGEADTGYRPFNLDLSFLDSGAGAGQPTVQTIIDEINNYFYPPPVKSQVGNLANIQLVSDTTSLPQAPATFSFDFDLENIDTFLSDFYVTDIQVFDDTAANITNVTNPPPQVALNAVNTFATTVGSNMVTVNAAGHGFSNGDRVYISNPGAGPFNGIPGVEFNTFFEVTNVTANSFQIQVQSAANAALPINLANMTASPPWDTIDPGEKARIRDAGVVDLDLSGNAASTYYDIVIDVGVDDRQNLPIDTVTSQITFRVFNNQTSLLNDRYNSTAISGNGTREVPNTDQPYMRAILVDANGNELPSSNGVYLPDRTGFLKLVTNDPDHTIAISELDSQENGVSEAAANALSPEREPTNRAFSHYFELNNFFKSNQPSDTGDTLKNSAINLQVEDRFLNNASLISLGNLERSNQPADPNARPLYTYERFISDNSVIQKLAGLGITDQTFDAAGGLSGTNQTYVGYMGQILAYTASTTVRASTDNRDSTILLDGFIERSDAFSGVNVDEEMANTIIFQNAYNASARIITATNEMFDALLGAL